MRSAHLDTLARSSSVRGRGDGGGAELPAEDAAPKAPIAPKIPIVFGVAIELVAAGIVIDLRNHEVGIDKLSNLPRGHEAIDALFNLVDDLKYRPDYQEVFRMGMLVIKTNVE
jgi:hypothetical protein